ncbi:MAG: ABC transporter substrate-binding protein [Oligoflexia bacterium]|nr:ABC transporter substrate-binding protein [Oligoflexia bacterium]
MTRALLSVLTAVLVACTPAWAADKKIVKIGHFPNLTHAQGLIAHQLTRQGKGWFEERLGPNVEIQWFTYNAGPSAMEAFFTGALDFTYVGPNPVLNAFAKSKGRKVRVIAGAASGGSLLMVRKDLDLKTAADFRGKKLATPQLGNTQDIAARAWLIKGGLKITQQGGDAFLIPTANPDQLDLLKRGEIDAVWTVEPWASKLEVETGAKMLVEDRVGLTTVLAATTDVIEKDPALVKKIASANAELTAWIKSHPAEAKALVQAELKEETTKALDAGILDKAWARIQFDSQIDRAVLNSAVADAQTTGFLPADLNFDNLLSTQW